MSIEPATVVLRQGQPACEVRLGPAAIAGLLEHHGHRLEIIPTGIDRVRLRARAHIGTFFAPGLELRVAPKCDTRNVLAMLGWAHELADIAPELSHHAHADDVREFLIAMLAHALEDLTRGGLRRGYVAHEDDLPALRGSLDLPRHLARGPAVRPTLPCRFEDYTADLPANQAIRHTLAHIGGVAEPALDRRLRRLRGSFDQFSRRRFRPNDFDAFTYDRLTARYRPIHRLCRLILEAVGADDHHGAHAMGSFVVDMNVLFERFVARWIDAHLPRGWTLSAQHPVQLDQAGAKRLRADLVLLRGDERRLVADTKFRVAGGKPKDDEIYQVLAYARALRLHHAVLLYPDLDRTTASPSPPLTIRDGANTIHTDGIALTRPWPEVEEALGQLLRRLLTLASA